jgi:hypothetical protein
MAFAAPGYGYAPTVYGDASAYGQQFGQFQQFGAVQQFGGVQQLGYDATQFGAIQTFAPQPIFADAGPVLVQAPVAPTQLAYTQTGMAGPNYPINLREGDFWNPAANTVFDRLVGTSAGKGALYNNQQKAGLLGMLKKNKQTGPLQATQVANAQAAQVGAYPGTVAAGPYGPTPYGPYGPYGQQQIVAPGPGPVVLPPTANNVYQQSPYGYGPVATQQQQFVQQVDAKGKPIKQKKALANLPTLAQVEAMDSIAYRQPIIGAPVPAGPPVLVQQQAYPTVYGGYPGAYPAF